MKQTLHLLVIIKNTTVSQNLIDQCIHFCWWALWEGMIYQAQFTSLPAQQYFYFAFIDTVSSLEDILPSLVMPIWFLIWWQVNDEHTWLGVFKPLLVARGFWGALSLQHEDLENNKLHKTISLALDMGPGRGAVAIGFSAVWNVCHTELFYSDRENTRYPPRQTFPGACYFGKTAMGYLQTSNGVQGKGQTYFSLNLYKA